MAEIDNTIALQAGKVPPPPDIIGPITSLAQLQYLQAHGAFENAQADFQQGKTGAYNSFGQARAGGASIQDALTQSNLPAYDPAGASSLVGIPNIERQNAAAAAYGVNPTPENAAGLGPEAYGKSQDARKSAIGVQADLATQKGQIASELLGGIVKNQDGSETLPPEVRSDLIQRFKAVRSASGQPLDARTEQFLWSAPVDQLKPLALGMQQGGIAPTDTPAVAGAKAGAVTAHEQANTPRVLGVTEGLAKPPSPASLPDYGGGPAASAAPGGVTLPQVQTAILGQESGNRSNSPTSVDGAVGPGQILPSTFKAYARPGESITNAADNRAVSGRIIADYMQRYNGDPARVATAYFSGPGNVSAPGSPTPWKANSKDGNGKYVSEYVHDMAGRLGGPASALPQPVATGPGSSAAPLQAAAAIPPGLAARPLNPLATSAPPQGAVAPIAYAPTQQPPGPPPGAVAFNPTTGRYLTPATTNRDGSPAPPVATAAGVVQDNAAGTANIAAREGATPPAAPTNSPWLTPPAMTIGDKAAAEAVGRGMGETQVKQFADAKARYQTATTAQTKLGELQSSLDELPEKGGFLTPGPGATERLGAAKYINTALQSVGAKPFFDPQEIGNAENSQKLTGTLGFDMSKGLGSREAASITETAIKLNPGIENTATGRRIISGALNAGMQRDRDFYQFISQNGNTVDADLKFNQTHPSAQYIQEAHELAGVPGQAIKRLQANPQLAPAFEQKYGSGLSRYFTGQ